ncbi:uncharacterized protein CMC5_070670 [Chondromyces crocatus]|uniref:Uncharacterized protein n=1 Tax=Chondromyces crocatus TaxID=52 RepID=A0A0K1EPU7_CHOCO|nr:uncharacterized protein CMC5_070670 [Chondromyces crocatus]
MHRGDRPKLSRAGRLSVVESGFRRAVGRTLCLSHCRGGLAKMQSVGSLRDGTSRKNSETRLACGVHQGSSRCGGGLVSPPPTRPARRAYSPRCRPTPPLVCSVVFFCPLNARQRLHTRASRTPAWRERRPMHRGDRPKLSRAGRLSVVESGFRRAVGRTLCLSHCRGGLAKMQSVGSLRDGTSRKNSETRLACGVHQGSSRCGGGLVSPPPRGPLGALTLHAVDLPPPLVCSVVFFVLRPCRCVGGHGSSFASRNDATRCAQAVEK